MATRVFDKYNQEILRAARGEVIEAAAESPRLEKTEQAVEVEQVAEPEQIEEIAQAEQFEETVEIEEVEEYVAVAEVKSQMPEEPQNQSTLCPFCAAENENEVEVCKSCQAMLSLADLEVLISHKGVNQDLLLQAIERMEVEKSLREFDSEELSYLAIAHLNAKNLEKGFNYLQEAAKLNPDNAILPSKIKFLKAHLEELTANKKSEGSIGRNRTILVVDDSPTVRKLISGKLEKCGHSVLSAIDGMDALAKINEVIPDLILLDITMPRLDGYQVCKLIRNNEMTKDVPIVMISGKDGFFDKVRGRMAGS
ncbi:MAG: response regulator, partial [Blastocatellia bacterium]|nr:response regulator [Blastocatellia bacterium]